MQWSPVQLGTVQYTQVQSSTVQHYAAPPEALRVGLLRCIQGGEATLLLGRGPPQQWLSKNCGINLLFSSSFSFVIFAKDNPATAFYKLGVDLFPNRVLPCGWFCVVQPDIKGWSKPHETLPRFIYSDRFGVGVLKASCVDESEAQSWPAWAKCYGIHAR